MAEIKPIESKNDSTIEAVVETTGKNGVTDPEVLLDETQKTIDGNTEAEADAAAADITSSESGAPGEVPKATKKSNASLKGVLAGDTTQAVAARSINVEDAGDYVTFVDADAESRDVAKAQRIAKRREANIVRQGTPVSAEPQIGVMEHANDTTVYPLDADATRRIVSGVGVAAPIGSSIAVDENEEYMSRDHYVSVSDDYLFETEANAGHGGVKNFTKHQMVMFEEYNENMNATGNYRAVRTGNFLITGINPLVNHADDTVTSVSIGKVVRRRKNTDAKVDVKVANHKLFSVIDVTATLDDIKATAKDMAALLVANESKMHIGMIEALADQIKREFTNRIEAENVVDYPEFYPDLRRSTLLEMDEALTSNSDYSCYNSIESIVNLMKRAMESEAMWLPIRTVWGLEAKTMFNGMKHARSQQGKMSSFPYYDSVLKASVAKAKDYPVPTMVDFLGTLDNTPKYDEWSKLLYAYSKIVREVESYQQAMDTSDLAKTFLTQVKMNEDKLQQIIDTLAFGKLTEGGSTTADFAKKGGTAAIAIGFDPNDLVDFEKVPYATIKSSDGKSSFNLVKPYLCCGWFNIRNKSTHIINDSYRYNFAPSWLNAIVNGLRTETMVTRLLDKSVTVGGGVKRKAIDFITVPSYNKDDGKYYDRTAQPFVINHDHPEWINFFMANLIAGEPNDTLGCKDRHSGYMHLFEGLAKMGILDKLVSGISIADAISKIINNPQLYPQANASNVMEMPTLWDSAINFMSTDNIDHQIAVIGNKNKTFVITAPALLDRNVFGLYDYEATNSIGEAQYETVADLLAAARAKFNGETNAEQTLYLLNIGENDSIVMIAEGVGKNKPDAGDTTCAPLILKRKLPDRDESSKRFNVVCDGASDIAHSAEKPEDQLYSHDNFYHADACDGYVVRVRKSYIFGDETVGSKFKGKKTIEPQWMVDVCPCFEVGVAEKAESGKGIADASVVAPKIKAKFADNRNKLVDDAGKDIVLDYYRGAALAGTARAGETKGAEIKESKLLRFATIPSLYGHKRRCPIGLINMVPSTSSDYKGWDFAFGSYSYYCDPEYKGLLTYQNVYNRNNSAVVGMSPGMTGFNGYSIEAYAPFLITDDAANSIYSRLIDESMKDGITKDEFISAFGYGDVDVSESRYWIKRTPIYVNVFGALSTGSEYVKPETSLSAVFADGGKPVYPGAFIDVETYERAEDHSDNGIHIWKTPGNHISPYCYVALDDAWERYAIGRAFMWIPAHFYLYAYDDGTGLFDVAQPGAMSTMPSDFTLNPVIKSKYYYCDYRDYVVHKPVITLNNRWYTRGMVESIFAKQFRSK